MTAEKAREILRTNNKDKLNEVIAEAYKAIGSACLNGEDNISMILTTLGSYERACLAGELRKNGFKVEFNSGYPREIYISWE